MKRYLALIVGVALALSMSVYAVNLDDYMLDDGNYDMDGYYYALACEKAAPFGDALLPSAYWIASEDGMTYTFDYDAFTADYDALVASYAPSETEQVEPSVMETEEYPVDEVTEGETVPEETEIVDTETEEIPESVDSIAPTVYTVVDGRGMTAYADEGGAESDSVLKNLVVSIFGAYEPILTTTTVTETIDGEVVTTLLDTVADGVAGVDFEWLTGVVIFCIVLFSFFRIVGVVFKR